MELQQVEFKATIGLELTKHHKPLSVRRSEYSITKLNKAISTLFGGLSMVENKGCYIHKDGTLAQEKSVTITTVGNEDLKDDLLDLLRVTKEECIQDSILFTTRKLESSDFI